jgi:hypothetical protein
MIANDQSDEPLDPALQQAAQEYHRPPDTVPVDAMWAAIRARRAEARDRPLASTRTIGSRRPAGPGSAAVPLRSNVSAWRGHWSQVAAAVFLVGVGGLGGWWAHRRLAFREVEGPRIPTAATSTMTPRAPMTGIDAAYRVAVTRDLTQAEALFTTFRDDSPASGHGERRGKEGQADADAQLASWANDVLSNTRLLLDSPAASDPQRRRLLEDLELVLVQMVELGPDHHGSDRPMIDRTLDRDHVLTRLHNAVPVGSVGL